MPVHNVYCIVQIGHINDCTILKSDILRIQQNEPSAYCPFACVPTVDRIANSNSSKRKCHKKSKSFYHMDRATCFFIFPILCQRAPNVESRKSKLFNSSTVQCVVPAYNWFHVVVFYAWRSTMQWCFVALNSSAFFSHKNAPALSAKLKKNYYGYPVLLRHNTLVLSS